MSIYLRYDGGSSFTFSKVEESAESGYHEIKEESLTPELWQKLHSHMCSCCTHLLVRVPTDELRDKWLAAINEKWKPYYELSLTGEIVLCGSFLLGVGGMMGMALGALYNLATTGSAAPTR